jgi:hypothetical protein
MHGKPLKSLNTTSKTCPSLPNKVQRLTGRQFKHLVVWWSEFLAANPEVLGSIPGAIKFSE